MNRDNAKGLGIAGVVLMGVIAFCGRNIDGIFRGSDDIAGGMRRSGDEIFMPSGRTAYEELENLVEQAEASGLDPDFLRPADDDIVPSYQAEFWADYDRQRGIIDSADDVAQNSTSAGAVSHPIRTEFEFDHPRNNTTIMQQMNQSLPANQRLLIQVDTNDYILIFELAPNWHRNGRVIDGLFIANALDGIVYTPRSLNNSVTRMRHSAIRKLIEEGEATLVEYIVEGLFFPPDYLYSNNDEYELYDRRDIETVPQTSSEIMHTIRSSQPPPQIVYVLIIEE